MKDFETIKKKYSELSDIMCFIRMIKGKKLSEVKLRSLFDRYVPRSDYQGTPKEQIIKWMLREIVKK